MVKREVKLENSGEWERRYGNYASSDTPKEEWKTSNAKEEDARLGTLRFFPHTPALPYVDVFADTIQKEPYSPFTADGARAIEDTQRTWAHAYTDHQKDSKKPGKETGAIV